MVVSRSYSMMIKRHNKKREEGEMILPEFFDRPNISENKDFWYDETPGDIEIDGECYETIIVEGWRPELYQDSPDLITSREEWNGEGELLAEICVESPILSDNQDLSSGNVDLYPDDFACVERYDEVQASHSDSDDCTSLSWLMNFKLDEIIGCRDEQADKNEVRFDKKGNGIKSDKNFKNNQCSDISTVSQNKPPYTYTKLIELALREKGELTVSGIYKWISERFPFFKPQDDRWKNSVRHNLSINPHFRKGAKAPRGAGHLWAVAAPINALDHALDTHKRLKAEPSLEQEVAAAAASILQQHPTEFLNPVSVEQVGVECGLLDGPLSFTY